jgi:outer membrane protein OmpA-like peptidoglycan-associated protein
MKNIITSLAAFALLLTLADSATAARRERKSRSISVIEQKATLAGDSVDISFVAKVGRRVARSGHTVVYRPYLTDGSYRWSLPEIVVRKARARVAERRHEWVADSVVSYDNPTWLRNNDQVDYSARIAWQPWMDGSALAVDVIDMGCCNAETDTPYLLAENLMLPHGIVPDPAPEPEPVAVVETPKPTTGDILAGREGYVIPMSEYDPDDAFKDREGALVVHFAVNSSHLDPKRGNNAATLEALLYSIHRLQASHDSRVSHIVIAGFASPEGAFDFNDRLAWNRASVLKDYIGARSHIDTDLIQMYNGVEDWEGLRMLVEKSTLANKWAVIDIIDNVPLADPVRRTGREDEIKKLDNGRTYQYMLKNFFPELRKAAYIKVFYENK